MQYIIFFMKTKIKILFLFSSFVLFTQVTHANWYGDHPVFAPVTAPGVEINCPEDWDHDMVDPVSPSPLPMLPGDTGTLYNRQARVIAAGNPMTCQYWDHTNPELNADNFSLTWTNALAPVTLLVSDVWWSWLNGGTVKYRWNDANCNGGMVFGNGALIFVPGPWNNTLYLCATDIAGNSTSKVFTPYKYDATKPLNGAITYPSGWFKITSIPVKVNATDDRSWIAQYEIQVSFSDDSPAFAWWWTPWATATVINTNALSFTYDFATIANTPGRAYKFQFCAKDLAGNKCDDYTGNPALIYKLDTVDPDPTKFNPIAPTANNAHLIATLSKDFIFNYSETGSPVSVTGDFEKNNDHTSTEVVVIPTWQNAIYNRDISLVPLVDVGVNGGRSITYHITKLKDEAGNESAAARTFQWYVYADKDNTTSTPSAFGWPYVANGQSHTWNITLTDQFWNYVIPASGINREVNLTLANITNTMFLNQFTRWGGSSVFISTPDYLEQPLNAGAWQALGIQNSNGIYPINIRVFTPTWDSGWPYVSDSAADFSFDSTLTITDILTAPVINMTNVSPNFIYEPLFTTNIVWDLDSGGFIEWVVQQNSISVTRHPLGTPFPVFWSKVFLDFSWAPASVANFDFYADAIALPVTHYPHDTFLPFNAFPAFPPDAVTSFNTRLTQDKSTVVWTTSDLILSTHTSYTIDAKSIVTNSYIIWRAWWYYGVAVGWLWTQVWVKILGSLSSKNISPIVTDQFTTGVSTLNNVNRWMLRQAIRKNVALALRNATGTLITWTINNVNVLPWAGVAATGLIISPTVNKSIMYIEKNDGNIELTDSSISGIRTVVIKGANLYIKNDMYYDSTTPSILGVIIQKNDAWQWGNLYIDPSLTNLVWTYIIDGSIMSYDGTDVLWYNASISDLKNQLYLFGWIVSENTIGWSKQDPPKCPSLVSTCLPTMEDTQKYDLNYLRRYYLFNGEPFGNAKVIGWETCDILGCTNLFTLPQKFILPSDPLAQYPFIIEFNPNILRAQPIGFENILE